jgi:geranyl-CoA carboxylase alpha subunit
MNDKNRITEFGAVLIANRGEIACRIIRTAHAMGLRTIAVYSEADAEAPHVRMADSAVLIGPAPAAQSYLDIRNVLEAAHTSGADAIHPGYGFLSENAAFARACADAGVTFIGPSPDAIEIMGDKAKAKRRMIDAGVPCVPGYQGEDQSDETLITQAQSIGFPIMVKAASGGGGRGMRLVEHKDDLANAITTARSEAENAFGAGNLILERAIIEPRHVEIQIFADAHGNVIHLGERDCSVQRRHQKVLEEAPSPAVTPELRQAMGAAAVKAARDVSYVGAGTVEFLLDSAGAFYFLEMNTRLQVEHPVTELVSGLDLVELQVRAAQGYKLGLTQDDVSLNGCAIEARLYAEDTANGFLPAAGHMDFWRPAPDIRTDAGIQTGGDVSAFYDPMLAKVIAYGQTRDEARRKLIAGLKQTAIFGVTTNKTFLIDALEKELFKSGEATTSFISQSFSQNELTQRPFSIEAATCAAVLMFVSARKAAQNNTVAVAPALHNWSSAGKITTPYRLQNNNDVIDISVTPRGPDCYDASIGDKLYSTSVIDLSANDAVLSVNDARLTVIYNLPDITDQARLQLSIDGVDYDMINLHGVFASAAASAAAGAVTAPMHGMLADIFVAPGQSVSKGDRLAVLEAMKMQHELTAPMDGIVAAIHAAPNEQVSANSLLIEIETGD